MSGRSGRPDAVPNSAQTTNLTPFFWLISVILARANLSVRGQTWRLAEPQLGSCAKEGKNESHFCQNLPIPTEIVQCIDVCPHFFYPAKGCSLSVWDTDEEQREQLRFSPTLIAPCPRRDSLSYGNIAPSSQGHQTPCRHKPHLLLPSHALFPGLVPISWG